MSLVESNVDNLIIIVLFYVMQYGGVSKWS